MANLQTVFFDVQQAVRAAEQAHEQLAFEGNFPSWPYGANPGYIMRGAIVALQNGAVGVVAPSATPSEIRVLTSRDDVAVSTDEAGRGKLSAIAHLALGAGGMSSHTFSDSLTGEKVSVKVGFEGPGECISILDDAQRVVTSLTPSDAVARLNIAMTPWVTSAAPRHPLTSADLAKATTSWGLQSSAMAPVRHRGTGCIFFPLHSFLRRVKSKNPEIQNLAQVQRSPLGTENAYPKRTSRDLGKKLDFWM